MSTREVHQGKQERYRYLTVANSPYNVQVSDEVLLCDCTGGSIDINLPPISDALKLKFTVQKTDNSTNRIVVDADGGELINGDLTYEVINEFESSIFYATDAQWYVVAGVEPTRIFPDSPVDPPGPAMPGDLYYNTALQMWLSYDGVRNKWLSIAEGVIQFSRAGATAPGSYFKAGEQTLSASSGLLGGRNGTVTGLSYTRTNVDAAAFEITADGVAIASLASAALMGSDDTLNADFTSAAVLAAKNQAGGNAMDDVIGVVRLRWRA